MESPLNGVKACVFDAYGTLFDLGARHESDHHAPLARTYRELRRQQGSRLTEWSQAISRTGVGTPDIVAGETDVFPTERRDMGSQRRSNVNSTLVEVRQGSL